MRPHRTALATLFTLAVALGHAGCDDPAELQNAAPRATWVAVGTPTTTGGTTLSEITLWVSDLEGDSVDVTVEVVDGSGNATALVMAPGGHGATGLTTRDALLDDKGQPHLLLWDVSGVSGSVKLRFTPDDTRDGGLGASAESSSFNTSTGIASPEKLTEL